MGFAQRGPESISSLADMFLLERTTCRTRCDYRLSLIRLGMSRKVPLSHPGIILLEDWLKPLGLSQAALARAIVVPPRRINEIVKGLRGINADTALRFAAFFGTDAQSWINLQTHYDTELAREAMAKVLSRIQPYRSQQRRLAALERMASNARELGLEY